MPGGTSPEKRGPGAPSGTSAADREAGGTSHRGRSPGGTSPENRAPEPTPAGATSGDPTSAQDRAAGPTSADPTSAQDRAAGPTSGDPTSAGPTSAQDRAAGPTPARPTSARDRTARPTPAGPTPAGDRPPGSAPRPVGFSRGPRHWLPVAVAAIAATVGFLYLVRPVLPPFLMAAALAYIVDPLVEAFHHRGLGRVWAILVTYAFVGLVVAGMVLFVVPGLIGELDRMTGLVPAYARRAEAFVLNLQDSYRHVRMPAPVRSAIDLAVVHVRAAVQGAIRGAVASLLGLFGSLVSLVLAPVLAYYLLADLPRFRAGLLAAVPPGARPAGVAYLDDLDRVVSGFVRGQLMLAGSVGLMVAIAMWLLGVRFALTLGFVAGLGELVPYFGPVMAALPALALGALGGPALLIKVVAALLAIQQVESAILAPKIVGHNTGLHPLTVVFALLAGGHFGGVAGLVLAVPLLAVLKVTAQHAVRWGVVRRGTLDPSHRQGTLDPSQRQG